MGAEVNNLVHVENHLIGEEADQASSRTSGGGRLEPQNPLLGDLVWVFGPDRDTTAASLLVIVVASVDAFEEGVLWEELLNDCLLVRVVWTPSMKGQTLKDIVVASALASCIHDRSYSLA
jgi:hypothetical protein